MYRRCCIQSSYCSASTAPTNRTTETRSGKIPTTLVCRRISLFNRPVGLLDHTFVHPGFGNAVHIGIDGRYAGSVLLADEIRPTSSQAVADLHDEGVRTIMITGDSAGTALAVGRAVGVTDVRADLLPEDKTTVIDRERAAGHRLVMVGDGVNDAPALAKADVGIAMGGGTDIARESSDVILVSSDPRNLVTTLRTARRAHRIVTFNFIGTVTVDLAGIVLAASGLLSPVVAAFVHVGSETAFILNSARLIPGRQRRTPPR